MGTEVVCSCVKALSGTWPPFGYEAVDGAGPDWSGEGGGAAEVPPATTVEVVDEALGAVLEGPKEALIADPPDTPPGELLVIPERIKRSRRSSGLLPKPGFTSSTT